MGQINACTFCIHSKRERIDGWIPTCDAFPNGKPLDFDQDSIHKNCNNGIGFEPNSLYNDNIKKIFEQ